MNRYEQLEKLQHLFQNGAITQVEYEAEKQRILSTTETPVSPPPPTHGSLTTPTDAIKTGPWGMDLKTYLVLLHLSPLLGYMSFGLGLIVPIVMWLVNKEEYPAVDAHGRVVMNWMISSIIYAIVFAILILVFIGIPLLIALSVVALIFPIVGALKAADGKLWHYPLTIRFI